MPRTYELKSPEQALASHWPLHLMGKDDIFMGTLINVSKKSHVITIRGINRAAKSDVWWFKVPGELWEDCLELDQQVVYIGAYTGKRDHCLHLAEICPVHEDTEKEIYDPLLHVTEYEETNASL